MLTRRNLLATARAAGALYTAKPFVHPVVAQETNGPHELPELPYSHDALEPHIDARTMRLHHGRRHASDVENLNKAVSRHGQLAQVPVDQLLTQIMRVPDDIRQDVPNHGGGHANHTMFWAIMTDNGQGEAQGDLGQAIDQAFGSFDEFRSRFNEAGEDHFGAGWVFLTVNLQNGQLNIRTRFNQDSPMMDGLRVILGNDLWEHAYDLKYNDRKTEYLDAWWNVVNWEEADNRYQAIRSGQPVV